jgi:hypothetical protein
MILPLAMPRAAASSTYESRSYDDAGLQGERRDRAYGTEPDEVTP